MLVLRFGIVAVAASLFFACATVDSEGNSMGDLRHSYASASDIMAKTLSGSNDPVAILALTNSQAPAEGAPLETFGTYYSDAFSDYLKQTIPEIKLVERSFQDQVLEERGVNFQGALTAEKASNLGAFLAARFMVVGSYTVFQDYVKVSLRVIDVRNATVAASKAVSVYLDNTVRPLLGLPTVDFRNNASASANNPPAEDLPGAITEKSFGPILGRINAASFDNDRADIIQVALKGQKVSASQVQRILEAFAFDDGKLAALKYLAPVTVDASNLYMVLDQFSFSSSIDQAKVILGQ